jgi:hypothetical protein
MAENRISLENSERLIQKYLASIEAIGTSILGLKGIPLIAELKRGKAGVGPYPKVSVFEAANRIMTDLVILYGVRWLLEKHRFPFESYLVEYGHENNNDFDIEATGNGKKLIGEAFNVAPSFFQGKKASMLSKLSVDPADGIAADFKLVMFNHDAVATGSRSAPPSGVQFVMVNIGTGECVVRP